MAITDTAIGIASINAKAMRVPPQAYFVVSAVFHSLGPACAVLLFQHVSVLGVAWMRIATAALVFAIWRRPWRGVRTATSRQLASIAALGAVLGTMNSVFYLAIDRLPLGTVAAIEFVGPVILASVGIRTARNFFALIIAAVGVYLLANPQFVHEPLGVLLAIGNCALFMLYIVISHALASDGSGSGIDRLATAMLVAFLVVSPIGLADAVPAFREPLLLGAAIAVGLCSSIVPYVCDQLAMARLSRATFSLLLALLPAIAVLVGALVLKQVPTSADLTGVTFVIAAVALHKAQR